MPKQVYISDDGEDNADRLNYCCGIQEVGGFTFDPNGWGDNLRIEDLQPSGTGLFIATITKTPECLTALRVLRRMHTVLYRSKYYKNTYRYADPAGKESGISIYVFKFGKETKSCA